MCFVWIWEQTAIISLYSINWLVCITETACVYCAVRTEHLTFTNSTFCPHCVFMCFVWIWEQTAIISLYSINWLVCITETECVYCAVRTEHLTFTNSTFCPHAVFMCFMWIWEQTAIISLYSSNWLVCITDGVCLLRGTDWTFNIHKFYVLPHSVFVCFVWIWEQASIISLYSINWLVCITETECVYFAVRTEHLTFINSSFCPHSVFMCFVWIWEQTAIISLYNIDWLVCITETECVYCAVRTGSLYHLGWLVLKS